MANEKSDKSESSTDGFIITKMGEDPEIGGRIFLQACNLDARPLLGRDSDRFFDAIMGVMHKLHATRYHLQNYDALEAKLFRQAVRAFKAHPNTTREALELIFELEAFLFQVKSSLDLLVKIVPPVIGPGIVGSQTFGDKGEKLIRGLKMLLKKTGTDTEAVRRLIDLIDGDRGAWIATTVDIRDELNHKRGLRDFKFTPARLANGQTTAATPRFRNQETRKFMHLVYRNNLEFHQDFMALCLATRAHFFVLTSADADQCNRDFPSPAGQYVKYAWATRPQANDVPIAEPR